MDKIRRMKERNTKGDCCEKCVSIATSILLPSIYSCKDKNCLCHASPQMNKKEYKKLKEDLEKSNPQEDEAEDLENKIRKAMRWPKGMDVLSPDGDSRGSIKRVVDLVEELLSKEYERGARIQAEMDAKTAGEYKEKLKKQIEKTFDGEGAYCKEDDIFFEAIKADISEMIEGLKD